MDGHHEFVTLWVFQTKLCEGNKELRDEKLRSLGYPRNFDVRMIFIPLHGFNFSRCRSPEIMKFAFPSKAVSRM